MRLALLALALVACRDPAPPGEAAASTSQPLESRHERVLDVRETGSIVGTVIPPPPDADPALVHEARWVDGARVQSLGLVQDAVFLSSAQLAVVDGEDTLAIVTRDARRLVDRHVAPGLAHVPACACLIYVRGEVPDQELVLFDLESSEKRVLSANLGPAWLPALSADGKRVAVASASAGLPGIVLLSLDGTVLARVPKEGLAPAFPQGPDRPVWLGDTLVFRNDRTTAALDLRSGERLWERGGLGPPRLRPDGTLSFDGLPRRFSPDALRGAP